MDFHIRKVWTYGFAGSYSSFGDFELPVALESLLILLEQRNMLCVEAPHFWANTDILLLQTVSSKNSFYRAELSASHQLKARSLLR